MKEVIMAAILALFLYMVLSLLINDKEKTEYIRSLETDIKEIEKLSSINDSLHGIYSEHVFKLGWNRGITHGATNYNKELNWDSLYLEDYNKYIKR